MLILSLLVSFTFANDPYGEINSACIKNYEKEKVKNAKDICDCIKRNYLKDVSLEGAKMMSLAYQGKKLGDLPKKIEGSQAVFDFDSDIKKTCFSDPKFVNAPEGPLKKTKKQ